MTALRNSNFLAYLSVKNFSLKLKVSHFANFTNVGSSQIHQIRKVLRAYDAHLIINKNTLTKKILRMRTEQIEEDEFKHLG